VLAGACPTGRTNTRIKGWLGRADQTTKVRGMFVRPEQVREALRPHDAVGRARLVVRSLEGRDEMRLVCEAAADPSLAPSLAAAMRAVTGLRAEIEIVEPGTLPDDGKLIDDQR
jgi:phenylacetate-CoA ligase